MSDDKIYDVPAAIAAKAHVNAEQYAQMYQRSVDDPDGFWADAANQFVTWFKPWETVSDWSYDADNLHVDWFKRGKLNVSYNCPYHHLQRPRPSPRDPRRPGRNHLGVRQPRGRPQDHLSGAARRGQQVRQRPQGQGREQG